MRESERTDLLQQELENYTGSGIYPFHMPGHKRRISPARGIPVNCDVTEVEGTDDLHHAEGILKAAMERTAAFFGSSRCWYLVGGSTAGNLAAVRAVCPPGSEIIAARNCHKSVYHAIELGLLRVHWLWPAMEESYGICGSITPAQVAEALQRYPASRAVMLTSPTYEGVMSDIAAIAAVCHAQPGTGIPLIVDEAHGAHLGLFEGDFFPDSAVHAGADLVIQSAHKTLPSLTQTALLHLNGSLVEPAAVEQQLNVFETSSPSYLLMSSLDGCTGLLRQKGAALFRHWREILEELDRSLARKPLVHLEVLCHGKDRAENHSSFWQYDPGKLLIHIREGAACDRFLSSMLKQCSGRQLTGEELARVLREDFRLETEMHCGSNVLCMTSCADTGKAMQRLLKALRTVDSHLTFRREAAGGVLQPDAKTMRAAEALEDNGGRPAAKSGNINNTRDTEGTVDAGADHGTRALTLGEAVWQPRERIPIEECCGRRAGEYIYPYPPGIPLIVPGEVITERTVKLLQELQREGTELIRTGTAAPEDAGLDSILCLREQDS